MDARANILGRQARYDGLAVNSEAMLNGDLNINNTTIRGTTAADDNLSTSNRAGSAISKAAAINDATQYTGVTAIVNKTAVSGTAAVQQVTLDSNNYMVINDEIISGFTVSANDADGSLIDAINAIANETGVIARLDQQLNLVMEAEDGRNIEIEVFGNAANLNVAAETYAGSITLQSRKAIDMVQTDDGAERLGLYSAPAGGRTILGVNSNFAVDTIDVTSRTGANQAMDILDVALDQVSLIRSDLGAIQNRLQNTVNNLAVTSENVTAARSRIQDADFATESAAMSRLQILQQAGTSILAQANQAPNLAMQLLG